MERQTQFVEPHSLVKACRDVDDNQILAAALYAACLYLVTGDSDLLVLKQFESVNILNPREFGELFPA
ncbi:MAG: putative toxin-antitoxin system toxin component, PIN family [Verrucomicrobiota bacterium]